MRRAYPGPVVTDDYFPSLAVHCIKGQLPLKHPQLSFSKPEGRCRATGRGGGREGCSSAEAGAADNQLWLNLTHSSTNPNKSGFKKAAYDNTLFSQTLNENITYAF